MDILDKFWNAGLVRKPEDLSNYIWWSDGESICWNEDNNLKDLYNESGNTYKQIIEHEGRGVIIDNCQIHSIDDSCGGSFQAVFSLNNKVEAPDE